MTKYVMAPEAEAIRSYYDCSPKRLFQFLLQNYRYKSKKNAVRAQETEILC